MSIDPSVYENQNAALSLLIAQQMELPSDDWSCVVMQIDPSVWAVTLKTSSEAHVFHVRDDEEFVRGLRDQAWSRAFNIFADRNFQQVHAADHNEAVSLQMKTIAVYERNGGLATMQNAAYRYITGYDHGREHSRDLWAKMAPYLEFPIVHGETFFVAPTIADAIESAARSLPGNYVLRRETIPADAGVVFFPEVAIGWSAGDKGITFIAYGLGATRQYLMPNHLFPWEYEMPMGEAVDIEMQDEPDRTKSIVYTTAAMMSSLFEFMSERILVSRYQQASRSIRRRAERSHTHVPLINVIELRARQYHTVERESDPQHRDYSVQWIVRGHWRNQWYPKLGRHQPKWITPYVKGPDDKPLKTPRANVFAVVR